MTYPEILEHSLILCAVGGVGTKLVVLPPLSWYGHSGVRACHQPRVVGLHQRAKHVPHVPPSIFMLLEPICKTGKQKC